MIKELCDELQAAGCFDTRYCLLGHSLGGWIAHELARELSSRGMRLPELCIIASIRAPCVGGASHDLDGPITHLQPSSAFWEEFFLRYGRNPDLLDDVSPAQVYFEDGFKRFDADERPALIWLFVGPKGTYTPLHLPQQPPTPLPTQQPHTP